jgi:hypothetical protein
MNALTRTQRAAAEETYKDSTKTLTETVGAFQRRYGGDLAELRADADSMFMKAYDQEPAPHLTWEQHLRGWIWFGLFDLYRVRARRAVSTPIIHMEFPQEIQAKKEEVWDEETFVAELTPDACTVLQLTLHTPKELHATAEEKGGSPRNVRSTLRKYLRGLGWTTRRVTESFQEIKNALK